MGTIVRDLPPPPEEETPRVENNNTAANYNVFPPSLEDDEALARRLQAEWDANDDAAASTSQVAETTDRHSPQNQTSSNASASGQNSVATISNAWEYDVDQPWCTNCRDEFNPFNRKHHCRLCGKIFCNRCSDQRALVPPSSIVLTPSKGGKKAQPPSQESGVTFTPDNDPDRMLTYIDEDKQLLYGKGLEER